VNSTRLRRLFEYAVTFVVAASLNFYIPHLMPGDPLALIAGDAVRQMGAEQIAELRTAYGLDQPLSEQYVQYWNRLLKIDLGQSYRYSGGRSVSEILVDRLGWTLFLAASSLLLATLMGSALGAWSAWRRGESADLGLVSALLALRSVPPFWLAMILIPVFAVSLRWFPSGDSYSTPRPGGLAGWLDVVHHAVLPVLVLTAAYLPNAFAIMRASMLGVLGENYIRTARAKGIAERAVLFRHALRNALLPVVTSFGLEFGQLLGGVLLIETVFNYRGIGAMMFEAVKSRDYPLLQGGFLVFTLGVLLANLLIDWLYPLIDPRLKSQSS
jgi:peptide/nickel transport system permease protein